VYIHMNFSSNSILGWDLMNHEFGEETTEFTVEVAILKIIKVVASVIVVIPA
jgi:hypothetical protein